LAKKENIGISIGGLEVQEPARVTWSNEEFRPNPESSDSNEEPPTIQTATDGTLHITNKASPSIQIDCSRADAFAHLLPKSIILEESQELSPLPPEIRSFDHAPKSSNPEYSPRRISASPKFQDIDDDYIKIEGVDNNGPPISKSANFSEKNRSFSRKSIKSIGSKNNSVQESFEVPAMGSNLDIEIEPNFGRRDSSEQPSKGNCSVSGGK
jgi:hypothetical protein